MARNSKSNRPVHEIRMGRIRAAIWENETQNGTRHNVTLSRLYKDDDDEWKDSTSFGRDDLPLVAKVADKNTKTVIAALIKQSKKLPNELYKSLTWDRGKELMNHRKFTLATNIDVYFCDPRSPWQRGSNENTNGLLRQYFPKGTDLSVYSQAQLNKVARQLNERPRKTLGFETPAERFNACVAATD